MSEEEFAAFLEKPVEGEFKIATPLRIFSNHYEPLTDSIMLCFEHSYSYEKWISPEVSLFLSIKDNNIVGIEIKGIKELTKKRDWGNWPDPL